MIEDRQPTFPTEKEFRGYLGQTNLGRKFLGIFDRYSQGIKTEYRTLLRFVDEEGGEVRPESIEEHEEEELGREETTGLKTTDYSHSDFPSFSLDLDVELNELTLEFDPYAAGGDDDIITLHAYLDSGKVEVQLPGNYEQDQHKPEFRKTIDRVQRFSSVASDLLAILDLPEVEPEEPEEQGEG
ncbi:MAG: hypothetical protein HY512_04435 [Candidatus Aenigmarchaeota archaeon]|nr:hypothetical protein [Candidatus Aenigmarchaeota archaeon]